MDNRFLKVLTLLAVLSPSVKAAKLEDIAKAVPGSIGKNSICFVNPTNSNLVGVNSNEKVKLASTTKVLTSFWAVSKLGPDYRFKTKVYFDPKTEEIHFSGERDPLLGERRMFQIISELNKVGISRVSKVTFDRSFSLYRGVESKEARATEITQRGGISSSVVAKNLKDLLSVNNWNRETETRYQIVKTMADKMGLEMIDLQKLRFSVSSVSFSENPLAQRTDIKVYETSSSPLKDYLKIMNRYSLNYPSDEIFEFLGGAQEFALFMKNELGITSEQMQIYAGSGLPNYSTGSRRDGWSTCETMVRVIKAFDKKLERHGLALEDVMMVGGTDPGTLGGFYGNEDFQNSVIAKTGTLNSAITLLGMIESENGEVFFGVFYQTTNRSAGRASRDRAVIAIADQNGGPKGIKYKFKREFVPFDNQSELKLNMDLDGSIR